MTGSRTFAQTRIFRGFFLYIMLLGMKRGTANVLGGEGGRGGTQRPFFRDNNEPKK